jgi:hypothetical protein
MFQRHIVVFQYARSFLTKPLSVARWFLFMPITNKSLLPAIPVTILSPASHRALQLS